MSAATPTVPASTAASGLRARMPGLIRIHGIVPQRTAISADLTSLLGRSKRHVG
jgi:hypothetical protein